MTPKYIDDALKQAEIALSQGEIPVGAVLVDPKQDKIIASSYNKTKIGHNPLAHAEINVITEACQKLQISRLDGYHLYSSLEPCAMCAAAIATARIERLYFAAEDPKYGAITSHISFFQTNACHHQPDYYYGFKAEQSAQLLKSFFATKRL